MPHKDRSVRLAYLKAYRNRPEEKKRRRRERPYWDMAKNANARARKYGVKGIIRTADVLQIFRQSGPTCSYCQSDHLLGLDHVVPLSQGGPNDSSNIVVCCRACNASKWQQEAPWCWSRKRNSCKGCATTERKHVARGYCNACYLARFGYRARLRAAGR